MGEDTADAAEVRAAGGVVWRPAAGGGTEIVLVHRPRYDDWSVPKGKVDDGETWLQTAVREIQEETGFEVEVGPLLGDVTYTVTRRDGSPATKVVRYWAMRLAGGAFVVNEEVDELRWVPVRDAPALLSYPLDRQVVGWFLDREPDAAGA